MTTITDALRAARACIQQDRTSLADTGMRHDNTMDPDAAAGVAEYDSVLQQIDAALAGMTHHITDERLKPCPFCNSEPYDARHIEYGRWAVRCRCGASGACANTGPNATDSAKIKAYNDARAAWNARALAAPAQQGEPFGYFRATAFGWEDCAEDDEGAIALYTAPAPAVPSGCERDALQRISDWSEHPPMLGVDHGSNGVRDYYRKIARDALIASTAAPAVPSGYALVSEDALRAWGRLDEVRAACVYPITAAPTPPAQPAVPEDVGSGLPSDPVAWRWFNSNGPVGDWRPLRPGKRSEIESQVADAGGRIEYACVQASPAVPESADPFLVRDIADMIGSSVPDVCKALVELGYPQRSTNMEIPRQEAVAVAERLRPAVPEDVAREPMTQKWCWWLGDAETFHVADTESEAHGEAQSRIDDDCEPGDTREYSVGRVQHPIDALGMDWLAEHAAETIEENACCWCDDNTGAEDPSITLAAEDKAALGKMVAAFLREKVSVHWWTADQATITTHSYVAGSNGDAARAAENPRLNGAARRPLRTDG